MQRLNNNSVYFGVAFASYYFIEKFKGISGSLPSGLYFNKGLSFINNEMKRKRQDIKLSHCWYRWGDEVVRYFMPIELSWTHEEAGYTKVDWTGPPPNIADSKISLIKELVDSFLHKYPIDNKDWRDELLADHYEGAPFEFQKTFKNCRDILFDKTRSLYNSDINGNEVVLTLFNKAFETFPNDKLFRPIKEFIPTFLRLITYPLSDSKEDMHIVNDLSEEFWYWFAYFLRVHPIAHENINTETLTYWRSRLEPETKRFYRNFDDYVYRLSLRYHEITNDNLLSVHLNSIKQRQAEWENEISEFEKITADLDEFLSSKIDFEKNFNN